MQLGKRRAETYDAALWTQNCTGSGEQNMAQTADYATFSLLTGASLCVGWYFSFHRKVLHGATTDEIFLGSKSLRMLPLAMSVLATMASATGVIGSPAHMYAYGFHMGWIAVSNLILIPIGFFLVVPVLYELKVTSVFQVSERVSFFLFCFSFPSTTGR